MASEDRVERALEVFVYAPLGLGLWVRDLAPSVIDTLVSRGKAELDRRQEQAQQHITTARSMGEVALAFGVPELRKRAEKQVNAMREQAERVVDGMSSARSNGASGTPAPVPARAATPAPPRHAPADDTPPAPPAATTTAETTSANRSASSAHLPIPGYDALSASQVVERLAGLGADELGAVREYELANRKRRTILGKIDQLTP